MTGDDLAHVLDAEVAFDHRLDEIAQGGHHDRHLVLRQAGRGDATGAVGTADSQTVRIVHVEQGAFLAAQGRQIAQRRGIANGDLVTVTSSGGSIDVTAELTEEIKPGVVSLPHGWGHGKPGTRLGVANGSPGVNTNVLSPVDFLDEPSGNGALNGIPVEVRRAR